MTEDLSPALSSGVPPLSERDVAPAATGMFWGAALGEQYRGGISPFTIGPLTEGMLKMAAVASHTRPQLQHEHYPKAHCLEAIAVGLRYRGDQVYEALYSTPYQRTDLRIGIMKVGRAAVFLCDRHRQDFDGADFWQHVQGREPRGSAPIGIEERLNHVLAVFMRHRHNPEAVLRALYANAELADRRMLAVLGSLCGIYHGPQGFPPAWLAQCADGSRLTAAAQDLERARASGRAG